MDLCQLERAAEFCTLVKSEHLPRFLGLDEDAGAKIAREARRVLRPGGRFVVVEPDWGGQQF